ncbi:cytochrome P450 736A117-like isoform X1 [Mangifera indica]|uniref:cytochrome P450 736A117-like isoform X1 n=1 Tax=Mangifera indica TaxID=29780 RepID=UPI001CF994BC|nr:cytochrome P450 736A117-like isoform X1 [Mangifera indica]
MLQFYVIYAVLLFSSACFLIKWFFFSSTSHNNLPPSPSKLPILGNIHQLGLYPYRSLQSLAQRYGALMLLHFGRVPVLIISSADVAREITKTYDLIFSNRPKSMIAEKLLYDGKDVSLAPYGEYWRQIRSLCMLQLLSNSRVQSFKTVREEEISLFIKKIEIFVSLSMPVNLSEMFFSLTNDVVCRAAFGRKYSEGEGGRKFKELLGEFSQLLGGLNIADFIPWLRWVNYFNGVDAKVKKVAKELDEFLDKVVEEHLHGQEREIKNHGSEDGKDFVDVLLEVQKDNKDDFSFGKVTIKALILDVFAAGTDTTYTVMEWAMAELLRHPRVMKELQNEVRLIGNGKEKIKEEDLDNMYYLKAVLKETLRLHPPVPLLVPRESTQDVKIKGYNISAGTMVITNAWAIGRDPASWDKPDDFSPERFLNNSIDFKGHDFQLIPFGAGRRGCPGTLFAMVIIEIVLANLVHKFDWSLPVGTKPEDLNMTEFTGLTAHRMVPLHAVATPTFY